MALRAGYYGVKRALKDKLAEIAGAWDQVKNDVDNTLPDAIIANTQLISDTVGFSGKNKWTGDQTPFTLVKSTQRTAVKTTLAIRDGKYIFSCVFSDVANLTKPIEFQLYHSASHVIDFKFPAENGYHEYKFEIPTGEVDYIENAYIFINSTDNENATVTISKIMVRDADIIDSTFENFHATVNTVLTEHKTTINAIISAATGAADFAAFKAAMEAITPVTRSLPMAAAPEEIVKDEIEEPVVEKKTTRKKSTAKADTKEEV